MSAPVPFEPPFDGSAPCPMCPVEIRNLHAVARNVLIRWDAISQGGGSEAWAHFRSKLDDLRRAVAEVQPLTDAHFADKGHAHYNIEAQS